MKISYMLLPGLSNERIILSEVCKVFNENPNDIIERAKWRKREHVTVRQVAMSLFVLKLNLTLEKAAWFFRKDSTTTVSAMKAVKNLRDTDKEFRKKTDALFEGIEFPEKRRVRTRGKKKIKLSINGKEENRNN